MPPTYNKTVPTFSAYDPLAGLLSLKWTTAAACSTSDDGSTPPPPPPKDDDKDEDGEEEKNPRTEGGMGFFGWFFTLFVSLSISSFSFGVH